MFGTNKIHIIFGLLALGAVVSVFSWFDYFNKGLAASFNLSSWGNKLSFATDIDPDKDGLSNIDESYWNTDFQNPDTDGDGFLDGEEVASGHDPTKPGPDDSLKDMNLTQELAELTSAGLYEGSLKITDSGLDKSLASLVNYATDNTDLAINSLVSSSILKIVDSSRENQDRYLNNMYNVIKSFATAYGNELNNLKQKLDLIGAFGFEDPSVTGYFANQEKIFNTIFKNSSDIYVPANWQEEHLRLMGEIKIAAESNEVISFGKTDPVKAAVAFEYFFGVLDRMPEWSWSYIKKNRENNIKNPLIESLAQ